MNNPFIELRDLNVRYGHLHAVKNVSLPIFERSITAFIGASGSGKSSVLRAMNRMLDVVPHAKVDGAILFEGRNVATEHIDVTELRRRMGMVFQNPTPFPMSIYDNIAFGLRVQGLGKKQTFFECLYKQKRNRADVERSVHPMDCSILDSLKESALWDEVCDRLDESAYALSGGQQQRLCIARAIAVRPTVILLDEPCSALDPLATKKIEDLLCRLKERYTVVIVTHNLHQARRIADHVAFFHLGALVEYGTTEQIFQHPLQQLTKEYVRGEFG